MLLVLAAVKPLRSAQAVCGLHPQAVSAFVGAMQLDAELHELPLRSRWATARSRNDRIARVVIVTLSDRDGTVGWGEAAPISRYGESVESVLSFLERVDPQWLRWEDVSASMADLDALGSGAAPAKSALNCALLDLAATRAEKPLHDLLGLGFQEGRHVTSVSIGIDSVDKVREKVRAAAEYPVLKLKLGSANDLAVLDAVRQEAPDKPLRADANEGWVDREQALRMIEALARGGNVQFVEQPLPAGTPVEDQVWLRERSPLPLMADESFHTVADLARCVAGFHGVNVKLAKTGGISAAIEALRAAKAAGLKTMLGCMVESSVGITAAAHLAELADYLDLDGNLLIQSDPFQGVGTLRGVLSFAHAPRQTGMQVGRRKR